MTIRVKVRILLLVSVSLTVFYIISHVYRLNSWFTEKTVVLKQEEATATTPTAAFEQDEAALDSVGDYLHFNATSNSVKPTPDDVKIQTFVPPNHDLLAKYQLNNRSKYLEEDATKYTSLQPQDGGSRTKHVQDSTRLQTAEDSRGSTKDSPASEFNVLPGITTKTFPTERSGRVTTTIPVSTTTDTPSSDESESGGDIEDGKAASTDTSAGSGGNLAEEEEEEDQAQMQKTDDQSSIPDNAPTTITTSAPSVSTTTPSNIQIAAISLSNNSAHAPVDVNAFIISPKEIPVEGDCIEHEGINEPQPPTKTNCDFYSNHLKTCAESAKYYSTENLSVPTECPEQKHSPICYFIESTRTEDSSKLHLKCNYSICHKNEVRVGVLNATSGMIDYTVLTNLKAVVKTLEEEADYNNKDHRIDFMFLSCKLKNKKRHIHQILPFPPLLLKAEEEKHLLVEQERVKTKINVNIVVLDSLSRKHFYRTLTKTVDAMKSINTDAARPTTILDFKGFQSLAPFTFVNLQALLTGAVDYESKANIKNRRYNFEDLFGVFQKTGFQTLLQEDTCWHDEWGSILTGNRRLDTHGNTRQKKIWDEIRNLTADHGIDGLGLTHMSCDVLAKYGVTNLFNSDSFVCFDGEPFSAYLLEHVLDNLAARKLNEKDMPLLSYTHINIAHESSGSRIMSMDSHLAQFVSVLGASSDTFTILLSDHGGKTTNYSRDTLAGRFEVYDPFLFMMVPKQLADIIGEHNMRNLIDNQNSLLDVIDIRSLLLTLNKILQDKSTANSNHLLTESIKHRPDCQHISIRNYGLCKCFSNVTFPDKKDDRYKEFLIWLGEFAVGHLNNILANQQSTSRNGHKCHRIKANNKADTINNVVEHHTPRGVVYLFDISTKFDGGIEVFNFQVLFNEKRSEKRALLTVEHWMRVSIYSPFASCRDKNVSHELCMCLQTKRERITKKYLNHYKQFGAMTEVIPIDNTTCAYLLRRTNLYVATFELVNMCVNRLTIEFSTPVMYSWEPSHNLPVEASAKAHTIQFLVTFIKIVDLKEEMRPKVIFTNK